MLPVAAMILDRARSETKRWGGSEPSLTHAAWALAIKRSDEFEQVFGPSGRSRVESLLSAGQFRGTEAQLTSILSQAGSTLEIAQALFADLKDDLTAAGDTAGGPVDPSGPSGPADSTGPSGSASSGGLSGGAAGSGGTSSAGGGPEDLGVSGSSGGESRSSTFSKGGARPPRRSGDGSAFSKGGPNPAESPERGSSGAGAGGSSDGASGGGYGSASPASKDSDAAADSGSDASSDMPTGDTGRSGSDGPANALPGDRAASSAKANRGPAIAKGLEEVVKLVEPKPDLGLRDREASDVAAQLLRSEPVIAAITGDPGTGRTALLGAIAARLDALEEPVPVWRIGPDTAGSSPTGTMRSVMATTKEPAVIVLDDLDEMADLGTDNVNRGLLSVISEARFHRNLRILVVLNRRYLSRLKVVAQSLGDALEITPLPELPPEAVEEIVKTRGDELAARFGLAMDGETVAAATAPRVGSNGPAQPGLGISRLDLAVARCHLLGDRTVDVKHLSPTLIDSPIRHEAEALATALGDRVKGQPEAIIRVADRLTITRAHLDLRPDRPNGVFLFIGPTGVGKTHLARELAVHEFGGADRLIRLDMSEYYDDWALSRIVGPAPGFVGSTEPESWLTTKVAAMPRSVVLLDEIEKAHPRVWNIFLQVFDAGRLTDSRGTVADFSESVVIMTSNLGLQEAKNQAVGFGAKIGAGAVDADRLMSIVKERMAPELINRLDDIVVFEALSPQAIEEIATTELNAARTRLTASGWAVHWDNEVTQWLATNGYDPAYGARHLQRNIEHEFIGLLSRAKTREVHFHVVDGKLVAESA